MRVITIQHKNVVMQLAKNDKYTVASNVPVSGNLAKPYQFMMKQYNYKNRTIFYCPVGYNVNFGGAKTEEAFLLELDIPDRYCKVQDYYGWSDFIYFSEMPYEYEAFNGCETVEQFGKYVLDMYKHVCNNIPGRVYQVTTQFILKSWVRKAMPLNDDFINKYIDNGGKSILMSIM